jgi:hypothetical protein
VADLAPFGRAWDWLALAFTSTPTKPPLIEGKRWSASGK